MTMKTNDKKTAFILTLDHLKLLSKVNMRWEEFPNYGGPAVDGKRPYGSSAMLDDIAEALNWRPVPCECGDPGCREMLFSDSQEEAAIAFHMETFYAIEICLQTLRFKPGLYVKDENGCWQSMEIENKVWP